MKTRLSGLRHLSNMAEDRPGGSNGDLQSNGFFVRENCTREELKIAVNVAIERFRHEEDQKQFTFPSSLTAAERKYVHLYCQNFGLKTKSHGRGNQRSLTVYKKGKPEVRSSSEVKLSCKSKETIVELLKKYPLTNKEKQEINQKRVFKGSGHDNNKVVARDNKFLLGSNLQIPPRARDNDSSTSRAKLPIHSFREKLLKTFKNNQVTLVSGDTGCGKTTQVGQYILEDATKHQHPCRVICTQPRRISAISVADRVAYERGEQIGHTVGYQIRLESRVSVKTSLVYCTNGVLLRLLMAGHKALNNITHVIIDEIHERDKFSDFLLICLRDHLKSYKNLKVILMSAALNLDLFKDYFGSCPVIHVPTMCHKVDSYFLEDVLQLTGYKNEAMRNLVKESKASTKKKVPDKLVPGHVKLLKKGEENLTDAKLQTDCPGKKLSAVNAKIEEEDDEGIIVDEGIKAKSPSLAYGDVDDMSLQGLSIVEDDSHYLDPEVCQEMDSCLKSVWEDGNEDAFDQIIHLMLNESVPVDYQHRETSMTTLMVAAARGFVNLVEQLIEFGADIELKDRKQKWTAVDWARNFNQGHIVSLFDHYNEENDETSEALNEKESDLLHTSHENELLELYHNTFDDDKVDYNLIVSLIKLICNQKQEGAILVFLPGYDDIVGIKDKLNADREFSKQYKHVIYMLHSMMQSSNQRKVFRRPQPGVRKIILSTNIAETSITIDDVAFVIDSGKVKEKTFDALASVSALRSVWISKASALQRRGRAGRCRPGECYHLISRYRFHSLSLYQDPELLRTPIHELCLQTKLLAAVNVSVADFLAKAPEAPPYLMIHNSLMLLKAIDALDDEEELTELGKLLVDLPIDPRLGKMILFGIALKCLDSVLTIATFLAYRDPFVLPASPDDKQKAMAVKAKFSCLSFSDHISLLRAYQEWSKAREEGTDTEFCSNNFVSSAVMEMISGMRSQMLGYLRNLGLIRHRGYGDLKDLNTNSQNWAVVKAAIMTGVYPAMLLVDRESKKLVSENEKNVRIHPSSVLYPARNGRKNIPAINADLVSKLPYDWLYYEEMTRMHLAVQVRCLSLVPTVAVALLAGSTLSCDLDSLQHSSERANGEMTEFSNGNSDSENEDGSLFDVRDDKAMMKIDDWIRFHGEDEALELIMSLKIKFLLSFIRKISSDGRSWSQADDAIVKCIVSVLTEEENLSGQSKSARNSEGKRKTSGNEKLDKSVTWKNGSQEQSRGADNKRQDGFYAKNRENDRTRYKPEGRDRRYERPPRKEKRSDSPYSDERKSAAYDQSNQGNTRKDRYFIVKCNNYKNLDISMSKKIWATTRSNERKLDRAFKEAENVYLIFSIQGSGNFQGYARMVSGITGDSCPEFESANLGGTFSVEWICKGDISFHYTQDLVNPWNENKKVQISRDGQELEPSVGEALCSLWNQVFPQQQHVSLAYAPEYHIEQRVAMQPTQQLDPSHAYAVVEGTPQTQVYITDGTQPAALYSTGYPGADLHGMQPQYHPQAVYTPQMPGFAGQPVMPARYQAPDMYNMHPQSFMPYRRQGNYAPRGIQYYQHHY